MAEDAIVQKITIEVEGDKAADALKEIGEKAKSSFDELEKAAKTAGVSIDDFGKLSQRTQQQYVELSQRVQQGSQQIVESTREVQQAASQAGSGTKDLGGGLDEVSQKSGVSNREMRALGRVMKDFGAGEVAGLAFQLNKMLLVFGPIGVAMLALGEAFSFVKGKMKEMEEAAKATVATMATLAQKSADANLEKEAVFWGMTTAELKKFNAEADNTVEKMGRIQKGSKEVITADAAGQEKAFIELLKQHGIVINDLMADEGKLGKAFYQTGIEAARLYKNLSPIEKLNFEKVLKGLGFTDAQIKSIEKGEEAFKKAYDAAVKQKEITDQLAASWDRLNKLFLATSVGPPPVEGWSNFAKLLDGIGDIIASVIAWFKRIPPAVDASIALVKAAIEAWVTTPVANAWQWIKDVWTGIGSWFKTKIDEAKSALTAWVTTPIANAWQWIKDTFNAVLKSLGLGGGGTVAAPGMASGGEIRGRSGTDTNLAWLTSGEFVMRREAVQRYGTGLMHAINSLQAPRFAMGGLNVGRPSLGSVSAFGGGLHNVTINFPGLPEIIGLRAPSGVVDQLRNAAAMAQVRSGGRKPSRYG